MALKELSDKNTSKVRPYMKRILQKYDEFRGSSVKKEQATKFWDLVVITTADADQSLVYGRQIASKVGRGELPVDLTFRIFSDPPGIKIGSGGSVLHAVEQLHKEYGNELYEWHILLICAGGQSQRLPTASVMGKLFISLPICSGDRCTSPYHMLDLKLALYLPFLQRARPGIFVTCSDDVETYCLPSDDSCDTKWNFSGSGFTALGHISSLAIGRSHGVYVLEKSPAKDGADVEMHSCQRVLQKPSYDEMKNANAILEGGETVCTDSIYFFDANVCKQFVDIILQMGCMTCEVDAYGDFLCPLGAKADLMDYIEDTRNVVTATASLSSTRRYIFELLHPFPLNVVVPKRSQFYHIGMMVEFVENLTHSEDSTGNTFFEELNCTNFAFSCIHNNDETFRTNFMKQFRQATVMHSVIGSNVQAGSQTVVEFCEINGLVKIGHHCIVSNCYINNYSSTVMDLPPNCCFHTIAVEINGSTKFVTIAFGLTDDLKKSSADWMHDLKYMGKSLCDTCALWDLKHEILFDETVSLASLWTANLFPVAETMEESFRETLDHITRQKQFDNKQSCSKMQISMQKALQYKDVNRMLAFQERLYRLICQSII